MRHAGHDIEHATHDMGVAAREGLERAKETGSYAADRYAQLVSLAAEVTRGVSHCPQLMWYATA